MKEDTNDRTNNAKKCKLTFCKVRDRKMLYAMCQHLLFDRKRDPFYCVIVTEVQELPIQITSVKCLLTTKSNFM